MIKGAEKVEKVFCISDYLPGAENDSEAVVRCLMAAEQESCRTIIFDKKIMF